MTRPSADDAGHSNLVVARDWRRELNQLMRREGDAPIQPKSGAAGTQATPSADQPTLIFTARQDTGKTALIVGTATTLYRFFAFEDNSIVAAGVVADGVLGTICDGTWLVIGSGFTTENAHRWEAKNVGGYTVFNNGIDLPVSYRLNELAVQPIHELREQGVSYVGTIEEIAGVLVCADIGQIHADYLATVMAAVGYGGFANGQESNIDRVHYDVMWADQSSPLRWGASVPGNIAAGSRTLTLQYNITSLQPGDTVRVVGAGEDDADLVTTLLYKSAANVWILADVASTTVEEAAVSKSDAAALAVGHYPLLDDSSAVIRMLKLQDRLLIAKADGFVIGELTGNVELPFIFQRVYSGEEGVFWRWTLVELNGQAVYAGRTEFYTFDLVSRRPRQHVRLTLCSNLFFEQVAEASQDAVFAADNGLTKEIWFFFPSDADDKAIAYDYRPRELGGDRCTTIGAAYTAAAMVERPAATIAHGLAEKWFVLGLSDGMLVRYLLGAAGPEGWQRRAVNYSSELRSGFADFGEEFNEKNFKDYVLLLASQSPNTEVTIAFYGLDNANGAPVAMQGSPVTIASPLTRNRVPLHYQQHLLQERISVTGSANLRIRKRRWNVAVAGGGAARV